MLIADAEELRLGFRATHVVQKRAGWVHALTDEVEVLLHLVHVIALEQSWRLSRAEESLHVFAHIAKRDARDRSTAKNLAALAEDPRVADRVTADHDTGGAGLGNDRYGTFRGGHVAVGQHGAAGAGHGLRDPIVMHFAPVHFLHGAAVDREQ